jgi:hypothetical protein
VVRSDGASQEAEVNDEEVQEESQELLSPMVEKIAETQPDLEATLDDEDEDDEPSVAKTLTYDSQQSQPGTVVKVSAASFFYH